MLCLNSLTRCAASWTPRSCQRGQKSSIRNGWGKFCSIVPDWERTWWYGSSIFPPKSVTPPCRHLKSFHQGGPGPYSNPNACRAHLSPENLPTNSRSSEAPAHPRQGSSGLLQKDGLNEANRLSLCTLGRSPQDHSNKNCAGFNIAISTLHLFTSAIESTFL